MNQSDKLLTMVLLTHNRARFLARAIRYYSVMPYNLLIVDSSAESNAHLAAEYGNERTNYQHCGNYAYWDLLQKLRYATKLVKTPYTVLLTDDDFTLQSGLDQSLDFLEAHPDYAVCHGYCLMYLAGGEHVQYLLRDKKILEDYAGNSEERILSLMDNYIPSFYAVVRSAVVTDWYQKIPNDIGFEYNEFGKALYNLARGKARILQIPYVVREHNYPVSEHRTDLYSAMTHPNFEGPKKTAVFNFLVEAYREIEPTVSATDALVLITKAGGALARCLSSQKSLTLQRIFRSEWKTLSPRPQWIFEPEQFVEMPFYNEEFFARLDEIDLLLRAMPCGKLQLQELGPKLVEQGQLVEQGVALLNERDFKSAQQVFETSLSKNPFHVHTILLLCALYVNTGQLPQAEALLAWVQRLEPKNPEVKSLDSAVHASREEARSKAALQSPRIAVLCHLYSPENWPSIAAQLLHLTQPFDLIVTASDDQQEEMVRQIDIHYPNAKLYLVDNRGQEIGPLFKVMEYEALENYDYVLKIHIPKPIQAENAAFRVANAAFENLLPNGRVDNLLKLLDANREVGLIGPMHGLRDTGRVSGTEQENTAGIARWVHRLGFAGTGFNYSFIPGSMFWIRGCVLGELRKLGIRLEDFESEPGRSDESLPHISAHVFSLVARKVGMGVAQLNGPA